MGLPTNFVGTLVFSITMAIAAVALRRSSGENPEAIVQSLTSDIRFLVIGYVIGIALTFLGAYVTAKLSKPYSTLPAFFFMSLYPLWYTALCATTILPVSLLPGCLLSPKQV
jgi:hypothetical protein